MILTSLGVVTNQRTSDHNPFNSISSWRAGKLNYSIKTLSQSARRYRDCFILSWWNIQEGEDKDGPPLQSCQPGVVFKSTEHNFSSHFFNMSAASQVEAKNRIKMVIITFSRGEYRHKIWVDERCLPQFRLFQYSLVMRIQGQSGTASKLRTDLVKTNNPYELRVVLCAIVSSVDFHYVPTYGFHTGRIQGYLENLKIEFQAWIMNDHWNVNERKFLMSINIGTPVVIGWIKFLKHKEPGMAWRIKIKILSLKSWS